MLELRNNTDRIIFDSSNYVLTEIYFEPVGATHSAAKGVSQVGERLINTTLDSRQGYIIGFIRGHAPPGLGKEETERIRARDMRTKKARLAQMCDPRKPFDIHPDERNKISCNALQSVKYFPDKLINNNRAAKFVIDFFCPDPFFSDAVAQYRRITEWRSNFVWPLILPHTGFTFADYSESMIADLNNEGDIDTGLLIHFDALATVETPTLTDIDTGNYIKLNRVFLPGEKVVVNTNYGQEGATSYTINGIEDVINDLDLSSTFLQIPQGHSRMHFTAETNASSMEVTIVYYQRYF